MHMGWCARCWHDDEPHVPDEFHRMIKKGRHHGGKRGTPAEIKFDKSLMGIAAVQIMLAWDPNFDPLPRRKDSSRQEQKRHCATAAKRAPNIQRFLPQAQLRRSHIAIAAVLLFETQALKSGRLLQQMATAIE